MIDRVLKRLKTIAQVLFNEQKLTPLCGKTLMYWRTSICRSACWFNSQTHILGRNMCLFKQTLHLCNNSILAVQTDDTDLKEESKRREWTISLTNAVKHLYGGGAPSSKTFLLVLYKYLLDKNRKGCIPKHDNVGSERKIHPESYMDTFKEQLQLFHIYFRNTVDAIPIPFKQHQRH